MTDKKMSVDECKDILKELKSVNRMVNYMEKTEDISKESDYHMDGLSSDG